MDNIQFATGAKGGKLAILHGNSNPKLARDICKVLNVEPLDSNVGLFPNGEISIQILDNVRGGDCFIIQPTCNGDDGMGVNRAVMELLLMIHTLKLAGAKRITAVIPHYGYARQDRKTRSRVPISASAVARMITEVGINSMISLDLHCGQIQGFFHGCPVADLNPANEFAEYARQKSFDRTKLAVVAPDAGAVTRARRLADAVGASRLVTILKRRVEAGKVDSMQLVGDVEGCLCIIVDDMIDTGGTLCKAASVLVEFGATDVHAYATHGILTDPACTRINECTALSEVVVTDTIVQEANVAKCPKVKVITVAPLVAEAIRRIHFEESIEHIKCRGGTTPAVTPYTGAMGANAEPNIPDFEEDTFAIEADANSIPK